MADPRTVRAEIRGRVGWIILDRPEVLNALNDVVQTEVLEAAARYDADPGIGAIVVTGSDRAFAAGADIGDLADVSGTEAIVSGVFDGWGAFAALRKPVIAAVAGYALGGGCELAMMCDIIVAADTARFGQPEITLALIPGMGGTQRLARAIGFYRAADLVLTGRMMDAVEAERAGLVSRVVPAADLLDEAASIADGIAARSLPSVLAAKEALRVALETPLAEGLRFERRAFAALFDTMDQKEGMAAFREKRAPRFENR
jgi:enoyl-CoA hydratase